MSYKLLGRGKSPPVYLRPLLAETSVRLVEVSDLTAKQTSSLFHANFVVRCCSGCGRVRVGTSCSAPTRARPAAGAACSRANGLRSFAEAYAGQACLSSARLDGASKSRLPSASSTAAASPRSSTPSRPADHGSARASAPTAEAHGALTWTPVVDEPPSAPTAPELEHWHRQPEWRGAGGRHCSGSQHRGWRWTAMADVACGRLLLGGDE